MGYVPDSLCSDVYDLIQTGWTLAVVAERVNLDAPRQQARQVTHHVGEHGRHPGAASKRASASMR